MRLASQEFLSLNLVGAQFAAINYPLNFPTSDWLERWFLLLVYCDSLCRPVSPAVGVTFCCVTSTEAFEYLYINKVNISIF